jgi:hypothetical protein
MATATAVKSFAELPLLFGQDAPVMREIRAQRSVDAFLEVGRNEPFRDVLRRDPCAYCGAPIGGTLDHIEARATGGRDELANLTGSCANCNTRKGMRSLLAFLAGSFRFAGTPQRRVDQMVYSAAFRNGRIVSTQFKSTRRTL